MNYADQTQFIPTLNASDYSDPERFKIEIDKIINQDK